MRITSGMFRGRRLQTPKGETTRPTTDKVKQAAFNIVQFDLEGAKVLDLFAGSGQLGLEALSRGAESCVFVERDMRARQTLEANIEACRLGRQKAVIWYGDAFSFLCRCRPGEFDLIFLDPPYGGDTLRSALKGISSFDILARDGIILCEKDIDDQMGSLPHGLKLCKEYRYGKTELVKIAKGE